jgi:arylformamidase
MREGWALPPPSSCPEPIPADLDAEYSPSRVVPEFRSILADQRRLSDIAKESLRCELGVRYGDGDGERLHHFPPRHGGSPLLVFVHGGHWQELGIDDSCFMAPAVVRQGAGVVVVGYPLAPKGTLHAMARSVATALDWVAARAADLGGRRHGVYAAGSSAGAHLLAMALGSAPAAAAEPVAGLALLSGVYDLDLLRRTYVNDALGLTEADARRASPVRFLPLRAAELVVTRGGGETAEYRRQHDLLLDGLRRAGSTAPTRSIVVRQRNHFDLPQGLGEPWDELGRAGLDQMRLGERS